MSKLMRISDSAVQKLESLSKLTGQSKQKLLDRAVNLYAYEQTLSKANEQYANLKSDKKAWSDAQKEQAEWDVTLKDGLEDND